MDLPRNVHLVPGTRGGNVYLVTGQHGPVLVDTGLPGNAGAVLRLMRDLGLAPRDLRAIVLTHGHPDHTGSARAVRDITGAPVLVHEADTLLPDTEQRWVHCPGMPRRITPRAWRVPVDGTLREGDTIAGMRVLHTPGHTPGSISLALEEEGLLFTGDLLTQRRGCVSRSIPFPGTDLHQYQESLERVAELPVRAACLGHGEAITEQAASVLRGAAAWYAESPYWRRWLQNVPGPLRPGIEVGFRYR